jgi:putative transposase
VKKKRLSVEQIVAVLKEAELGTRAAELIRKVGISEQTFYRWKKVYGGLEPGQARRLKQLEEELPSGAAARWRSSAACSTWRSRHCSQ